MGKQPSPRELELEEKISLLEMEIKHLNNDLKLTKEENEITLANYFELYCNIEKKVAERAADLKSLKKKLEQKARELELIIDSSPGIIFYKDREQMLLRINKKFAKMVGLPVYKVIGKKYTDLFPENKAVYLKNDQEVLQEGKPVLNRRESVLTAKGRKEILIDRIPYKDIDNRVVGLIGFALDITDIQKAEKEKRRLEEQLQYAQRMESIGTLAGGIAHNFNNILMGILGNVSLMLLRTDSSNINYKNLKTIEKLIRNGSELTGQLLGYARKGNYEITALNLNQLVKETSHTFSITRKEVKVHHDLAPDLLGIKADGGQIEQVLLNLYINAADAISRSGDLFLKTRNVTHEDMKKKPYQPNPGNYVLLTVRDNGSGMDKETMVRIFEPFFTTKGLTKGTGLGLASVYGIIKAHAGYIDVSSVKGKGTTFYIYLPATEKVEEDPKDFKPKVLRGSEGILIVDDEEMIIDTGKKVLEELGYSVLIANSGNEAIEVFQNNKEKIDIVLLDTIMPDMSGGETFERLKEINPDVKVLLMSGYSIDGQAQQIMDRGCHGFIQKPFSMEDLSQKLREILQ